MSELKHNFVHTNGIRLHYVEAGSGPLIVLCHGWPESWYSWRHQLPALSAAGFRVIAPDQRGYGQTDRPQAIAAYNILDLVGDIVGLVNTLGEKHAVIVGHDWGAIVAQQAALLRPDLFRALGLLSVPFIPRGPVRPAVRFAEITRQMHFYQDYFQEPDKVERELEEDVLGTLLGLLAESSLAPGQTVTHSIAAFPKDLRLGDVIRARVPNRLPAWLTQDDIDFYVAEFARTGFRGGINWYRNIDRNWELTPFQDGAKVLQPTVFIAGERDLVLKMAAEALTAQPTNVPNLKGTHLVADSGHWVQQQKPDAVNELLLGFLTVVAEQPLTLQ
jgi:pimeloyl-ACP methyl ester carboxylesterase